MAQRNSPDFSRTDDLIQPSHHFDIRTLWHILLEHGWIIAICFAASALLSAAYIQRTPQVYAATVRLQVEQEEQRVMKIEKVHQEDLRSLEILRTIEQTLQSRAVLERVIDFLQLGRDERFVSPLAGQPSREQLVNALSGMVDVRLQRGTRLIVVRVIHTNPVLTEKIANALVKQFMQMNLEYHVSASQSANEILLEEAQTHKKKLQESENALQAYREKIQSISLEANQNLVLLRLKELSARLTEAESMRLRLAIQNAQVEAAGENVHSLMVIPVVATDTAVMEARSAISRLESEFANLRQRYLPKHPKFIQAVSQLEEWRNIYTNAVLKVPRTLQAAYESALAAEQAAKKAFDEQEQEALALNKLSIQYNVLARDVESDRALYESILNRLKETSLMKEIQTDKIRIIEPAYIPGLPFSPNKKKILAVGLLAGIVGGMLIALGLSSLDTSIKTVDQAEEILALPVLSAIPQIKAIQRKKRSLIVSEEAKSPGAEAFRSLRTSLSMLGREEDRRTFLFTSALPQEGKTFCSLNYAVSLAQQGLRTVVIDGDLRRPAVEETILGKRVRSVGVSDYLTRKKMFDEIVQATDTPNFSYISAGTTAPNPAELLAQRGFDSLIEEALRQFDRVVVDSAPIHAVSDTLLMLGQIQTVCLVLRACKTPRKGIARAILMLQKANAPLGGLILNRQPRRKLGGYYYDPYYNYAYQAKYAEKGVYGA
jgi:polysaccharide biosynthesis transport protein